MSQNQIQVNYKRGGRAFSTRSFTLAELKATPFSQALSEEGVTAGLNHGIEIYVRSQEGDSEISASNRTDANLESVLREASEDGKVTGKCFIIDCTAEQRGADLASGKTPGFAGQDALQNQGILKESKR